MAMKSKLVSRRELLVRSLAAGTVGLRILPSALAGPQPPGKDTKTETWQIGCYTRPWDQYDYRVALDAIAEAGFTYVGLMTTQSPTRLVISAATSVDESLRVGDEVRKRGLKAVSLYGGDFPVNQSLDAGIQALQRLIDNCAAAGAGNLMLAGTGDPKLYDTYYQAVTRCCDDAAAKRIGLSLKPHGGLNATGPQCRKAIEQVGHRNFRLWYDPGNVYYYSDGKLDPVEDAGTVDGLVVGMSVKDYLHPRNVDVTPGTGKVDFTAVMARLKKGGFTRGPLIVETLARGDRDKLLAEAKKARTFLEHLTGQKATTARAS